MALRFAMSLRTQRAILRLIAVTQSGKERTSNKSGLVAILSTRLRFLKWLPSYTRFDLISDFVAGITVGLTMMPQSIAYAALADVPAQYGLYTALMGSFVYIFFGTIKEVSIGPSSLMTLLAYSYTNGMSYDYMVLLCFLSGCVELFMGLFQLGFLVDFISAPVTSGFTSATSITIILAQLKGLFGIAFKSNGIFDLIKQLCVHIPEMRLADTLLGFGSIGFLIFFKLLTKINVKNKKIKKCLWFLSISKNALVVVFASLIALAFHKHTGSVPFKIAGSIPSGFPEFKLPKLSVTNGNETVSFVEMVQSLGSGIFVVPIMAILANVAIAKSFASGTVVDATQEMMTLGLSNIFGSFVSGMPTTGAFTRSAVNHASGVRTPLNGLYAGLIIIMALFLTPYFYFIPRATLAAVLISAVCFMIDYEIIPVLWRNNKFDLFINIATFISSLLLGIETGLMVGVLISVLPLIKYWTRPHIYSEIRSNEDKHEYLYIKPEMGLFFPAVDYLTQQVIKRSANVTIPVVVDFSSMIDVDYTACKALVNLVKVFENKSHELVFLNVNSRITDQIEAMRSTYNMHYCENITQVYSTLFDNKNIVEYTTFSPLIQDKTISEEQEKLSQYEGVV